MSFSNEHYKPFIERCFKLLSTHLPTVPDDGDGQQSNSDPRKALLEALREKFQTRRPSKPWTPEPRRE